MAVTELIVTSVASLAATLVGGSITYFTQRSIAKQQFEKEHRAENEKLRREKLEFYGKLLKVDGENQIILCDSSWFMYTDIFRETIREVLYDKIYLLTPAMITTLREIDNKVDIIDHGTISGTRDHHEAVDNYLLLINMIEKEIEELQLN